jgi:hypothetical protein
MPVDEKVCRRRLICGNKFVIVLGLEDKLGFKNF